MQIIGDTAAGGGGSSVDIMDASSSDQPNSICHVIEPIELYQLKSFDRTISLPFGLLAGEAIAHYGTTVDGLIVLTNYRLFIQIGDQHHHVPLGLIEIVEQRELFYLHVGCKDARTYRCIFDNNENCLAWCNRIVASSEPPKQLNQLFAFYHFIWSMDINSRRMLANESLDCIDAGGGGGVVTTPPPPPPPAPRNYAFDQKLFKREMERLNFQGDSWRITEANKNYKLCPTYPPYLIVPSCITDSTLELVAKFRSSRRIPAVVWRHRNGAVVARCSQPEVGWLGWRSNDDEALIKSISEACRFDQHVNENNDCNDYNNTTTIIHNDNATINNNCSNITSSSSNATTNNSNTISNGGIASEHVLLSSLSSHSSNSSVHSSEDSLQMTNDLNKQERKKVLIMDARSYTTAVANRARGGGCECPEYYPNCEIQFMNLANIHSIRKSFHALRLLCTSSADQPTWFSQLEGTRWFQHMSGLMKAAVTLVTAVERDARPVLVHCSDGWDRTPQIVALAELLLDPYYRTIDGFRILIEREWLAFGHKFADRCGHSTGSDDQNERCPVFLQWLDCAHQLLKQFPCAFEFSHAYLVKLAQHTYSNLYGTFLCNTFKERQLIVNEKTYSVWEFLNSSQFRNHLYAPPGNSCGSKVLWPLCNVRDLKLWSEIYLGLWETNYNTNASAGSGSNNNNNNNNNGLAAGSCPGPPDCQLSTTIIKPQEQQQQKPQPEQQQHINNTIISNNMTKTRSYGDLIDATTGTVGIITGSNNSNGAIIDFTSMNNSCAATIQFRRSSDPSINIDKKLTGLKTTITSQEVVVVETNCSNCLATTTTTRNNQELQQQQQQHQDVPNNNINNTVITNKTTTTNDDDNECNKDCIFRTDNDNSLKLIVKNGGDNNTSTSSNGGDNNYNNNNNGFLLNKTDSSLICVDDDDDDDDNIIIDCNCCLDDDDDDGDDNNIVNGSSMKSICLNNGDLISSSNNNINHCQKEDEQQIGDNYCYYPDRDELMINSEIKSDINLITTTTCDKSDNVTKSIETSTDTLVSSGHFINGFSRSSPIEIVQQQQHQQQRLQQQQQPDEIDSSSIIGLPNCKICTQNLKFAIKDGDNNGSGIVVTAATTTSSSTVADDEDVATPLQYSRTSSSNGGWDHTLLLNGSGSSSNDSQQKLYQSQQHMINNYHLGDDGLIPVRSVAQERLWQIIQEHRRKEELLQKELQTYRQALIKQVCHRCCNNDLEKIDDASDLKKYVDDDDDDDNDDIDDDDENLDDSSQICFNNYNSQRNRRISSPLLSQNMGSAIESVNSMGEYGPYASSAVESLRSSLSWEALEEGSINTECTAGGTLWVPDHAVDRCTGCHTEFWIGKRKHHCRNCGRIFCADCSEKSASLPSERLYKPVRVCTGCYSKLKREGASAVGNNEQFAVALQCKHNNNGCCGQQQQQQTTTSQINNNSSQIVASSN